MSRNASAMGYIGVRSEKLSSIYADNYLVPNAAGASATIAAGALIAHGQSGTFSITAISTAADAHDIITVTNDVVNLNSKTFLTQTNAVATNLIAVVNNIVQGAYDVTIMNVDTGAPAAVTMNFSYIVFNTAG